MRKPRIGWQALSAVSLGFFAAISATAALQKPAQATRPILSDPKLLRAAGIPVLSQDEGLEVAVTRVTPAQERILQDLAHDWRRCGGYERLEASGDEKALAADLFRGLRDQKQINDRFVSSKARYQLNRDPKIQAAVDQVNEDNLKASVTFLSSYFNRFESGDAPNTAILEFKKKLEELTKNAPYPVEISLISHQNTRQNSLRLRIPGSARPSEIVVLGAHIDSINHREGRRTTAPGADDNASGSSNLFEAVRILLTQPQPQRSVEFFWYAAEEVGLVGSAEIARSYKSQRKDVIGALQLDMTLHPGNGEFVLASINDFTSAWLRSLLVELGSAYLGNVKIVDDKCGYGCSDHASWYRQGYPSLMPAEAKFDDMFPDLHSKDDVINPRSSFRHSAVFSKIAVAFAMELGNSTERAH